MKYSNAFGLLYLQVYNFNEISIMKLLSNFFHLVMIPSITQKVHRLGISAEPQRVSRISQIKLDGLKIYEKNQRLALLKPSIHNIYVSIYYIVHAVQTDIPQMILYTDNSFPHFERILFLLYCSIYHKIFINLIPLI